MNGNPDRSPDDLARRLDAIERELASLRNLLIRAYDDTPAATRQVLAARRDPAYGDAYGVEPLITVRIGSYPRRDLLFDRCLASVRAQTYTNWEAVVVCDRPDEEVVARVAELGDQRIRCVQRPRQGPYPDDPFEHWLVGGVHPFNQAIALARGAWIAPIDDDDAWDERHLELLLDSARRSGAEVVYGVSRVILSDGSETYFGSWPPRRGDFGLQATMYHAGLAPILFDANSHLLDEPADWNLARRLLEAGASFEFVEEIVTSYFVNENEPGFGGWKVRQEQDGPFRNG